MCANEFVHATRVRVRYAETDQMGVAYHANYVVWMEVGRVEYCRALGIRYKDMEERSGILLAVVEVQCKYRFPARYDDEVIVRTRVSRLASRSMQFDYEMRLVEGGRLLAEGYSRHIICDRAMRPVHLPPEYREAFRRAVIIDDSDDSLLRSVV